MVTKCYNLVNNIACGRALAEIAQRIPCFIEGNFYFHHRQIEVTIECREADLPFVEKMLAHFV